MFDFKSICFSQQEICDILPISVYFIGLLWRTTCPIQSNFSMSFDFSSTVEINENHTVMQFRRSDRFAVTLKITIGIDNSKRAIPLPVNSFRQCFIIINPAIWEKQIKTNKNILLPKLRCRGGNKDRVFHYISQQISQIALYLRSKEI